MPAVDAVDSRRLSSVSAPANPAAVSIQRFAPCRPIALTPIAISAAESRRAHLPEASPAPRSVIGRRVSIIGIGRLPRPMLPSIAGRARLSLNADYSSLGLQVRCLDEILPAVARRHYEARLWSPSRVMPLDYSRDDGHCAFRASIA